MTDAHGWPEMLRLDDCYRDEIVGYMQTDYPDGSIGVYRRADLPPTEAMLAPGHTDLMVSPETIDAFMAENPMMEEPAFFSRASFSAFTEANDVGDDMLLHGQPGKRSAITYAQIAADPRVRALVDAEREACAAICENYSANHGSGMFDRHSNACADLIRARSATERGEGG